MIREAKLSDFAAIAALEKQMTNMHGDAHPDVLWKERFNGDCTKSQDDFEEFFSDEEWNLVEGGIRRYKIFVFEENGDILGYCKTQAWDYEDNPVFCDARCLAIEDICVDEKSRGKGIGKQLFNHAKAYAKKIGAVRLQLAVWDFNEGARKFYENLGMSASLTYMHLKIE